MKISIIIPVFNEAKNVEELYKKIKNLNYDFEIIFVDDGSKDRTFEILDNIKKRDSKVKIIRFRKNFGKSAAYSAGFENAKGDIIITMDGDLQDDPEDIKKFIDKLNQGYDFVSGWKINKYKFGLKSFFSFIFNNLTSFLTGIKLHDIDCSFKGFRKNIIKEIEIYGDLYRYIPVLAYQYGFKLSEVKIRNYPRKYGKSKFKGSRVINGLLDLITVFFLTKYNKKPLHFFGILGLLLLSSGFAMGFYLFVKRFVFGILIVKEAWVLLTILLIILGIQFISVGLIGEMLINLNKKKRLFY